MIKQATQPDALATATLALLLWPNHSLEAFAEQMAQLLKEDNAAIFLAYDQAKAIGFAQCRLRTDYVEGTNSSPVGYLEGLFVMADYRQQGYARQLVAHCEQWAKKHLLVTVNGIMKKVYASIYNSVLQKPIALSASQKNYKNG